MNKIRSRFYRRGYSLRKYKKRYYLIIRRNDNTCIGAVEPFLNEYGQDELVVYYRRPQGIIGDMIAPEEITGILTEIETNFIPRP